MRIDVHLHCDEDQSTERALALIIRSLEEIQRIVKANEAMLVKITKFLLEPKIIITPGQPQDKEL